MVKNSAFRWSAARGIRDDRLSNSAFCMRLVLATLFILPLSLIADEVDGGKKKTEDDSYSFAISKDDPAEVALKKFTIAPGLQVEVWAAEPLLANPVAFAFDEKGRAFVAETYRRRSSVPDIRKNEPWTIDNLALRSVEERIAFVKARRPESEKLAPSSQLTDMNGDGQFDWRDWTVESERIKLVVDSDGDGKADQATVFAEGFKSLETGIGAGVAAGGGSVFYTCIPDVWRFDGEEAGAATQRTKLHTGFGVHVAYSGHDMHGLKIGPDGRLYWTIADCGARVTTMEGKVIENPDSGAVFRCNLDGSGLELVATGLRNPQSLAFNAVGDLFTADNNADGGDKARWTHLVEGADYGWRIGWQFLPNLGAWNSEGMWHLDVGTKHLALLPPVGHIGHGPGGIAYYPGTGLPDTFRDHFFYADFPGGVRSFALQPQGASYTVENPDDVLMNNQQNEMTGKLLWGSFPSDVGFGSDGGLYVLDWVEGWEKTGKGRIFRVHAPAVSTGAAVQETKRLLAEGMSQRNKDELAKLLWHADQRVRTAAQFALVETAGGSVVLREIASGPWPPLARLHAIWGLGQIARAVTAAATSTLEPLHALLSDADSEVRAQAARTLAGSTDHLTGPALIRALKDPDPRVQFFAAEALAHAPQQQSLPELALPELYALLHRNADHDPFVRHAVVRAVAHFADAEMLAKRSGDPSESVRTGVLLALRRLRSPEIARFLTDANPQLVLEAARAIHEAPIPAAWPQLAALAAKPGLSGPIALRAVNANYLLGNDSAAQQLGHLATDPAAAPTIRLSALESLAVWNAPFGRDRITGLWRDLPPRAAARGAIEVATRVVPALLNDGDGTIRQAAAKTAGALKLTALTDTLLATLSSAPNSDGPVQAAALRALDAMNSPRLTEGVKLALKSQDRTVLEAARELAAKASPEDAVALNTAVLGKGGTSEQQHALAVIAAQPVSSADVVIAAQLDRLLAGKLQAKFQLDLLEAAARRSDETVKQRLAAYDATRRKDDPLAAWRECLEGGDIKLGKEIFAEKAEAACLRCHKVKGEGGDVGPDLVGLGQRMDRASILQSIIDPNAAIAPGYENVLLTLQNGDLVGGLLHAESPSELTIVSLVDGKKQQVKKGDIKERTKIPSAMPPGLGDVLGKRALRDVIEYLATVK
jgi:quinoprotein glucose dehydrogenase